MNKAVKTILWLVAIILVIWGIVSLAGGDDPAVSSDEPIEFGYLGPLTGNASSYGESERYAVEMAVEEINAAGGIDGRNLQVVYEDGKCTGADATTATQKLINVDNVDVILGGACSGETLAAAPLAESAEVILFSSFSSNPAIADSGEYIFRNVPSDIDLANSMADLALEEADGNNVAILSENTDFALGVRDYVLQRLEELGANVVADELYNSEDSDFRTQLTKIKNSSADVVIFNPQAELGGLAVKQAKTLQIEVPLVGGFSFSGGSTLEAGGSALNGFKFVDAPGLDRSREQAVDFLSEYEERFGKPAHEWLVGARYDSLFILRDAIESCGEVDTDCIKDYLYDLEEYTGVLGTYSFDDRGDLAGANEWVVKEVVDASTGEIRELNQ